MFSSNGYSRASLDDIAAEAGLTKGAVYSSFGSKSALFLAVLHMRTEERVAASEKLPAWERGAGVGELLERFTVEDPTWHRAFIEFWSAVVSEAASSESSASAGAGKELAELRESRGALRARIGEVLIGAGVDEERAGRVAVSVLALSNGLAIERSLDEGADSNGAFADALEHLMRESRWDRLSEHSQAT